MIDAKRVRESLTPEIIIRLMRLLGATEFQDKGDYIQFPTICHNLDEKDAGFNLSYYKESKRFYCFSNCHSMDIFQLIKRRWELIGEKDTFFDNIVYWVMNHAQVDIDDLGTPEFKSEFNIKDYQGKTNEVILPEKPIHVLDSFSDYHAVEWLNDGISDAAMNKYNIKYSISKNAVIIPHYDIHGRLIGVRRRALNPEEAEKGKYKPIYVEGISYAHPLGYNLYGLNFVKDEIKAQRRVFIAEGEKSALQGYTMFGDRNVVVAACGSRINRWQIYLLTKYCKPNEIIIAFDKGLDYDLIHKMCEKYSCYAKMSYICDPNGRFLKDKESPFDRPEVLDELIDRRVIVK